MDQLRRIRLLDRYFFNRRDHAAALMGWGKPHPVIAEDNLLGLLRAHVMGEASPSPGVARYVTKQGALKAESGHFRLGSYAPDLDGNTRWLCIDLDGPGHSDALADPEGAVQATHTAFAAAKFPAYIEQSGGGKGWHIWVFFDVPIPAKLARRLACVLVPGELRLARGGVAVPRRNRGVEIFPKVDRLKKPSQLGNLVWLPWFHGAPEGANQFYREDGNKLVPYDPEDFETVTLDAVEEALTTEGAAEPQDAVVEKFLRGATRQDDSPRPPSSGWREWKERALAGLPLERIYGDLLTGEAAGEGWLRCRDPDSPSGSESRSGNVADGNGIALRGTYRSWRTEEGCSVFDFMVQRGMATSFIDAAGQVAEMTGVPLPEKTSRPPRPVAGKRGLPVIVTNERQTWDIVTEARNLLEHANGRTPFLFQQDQRLLRIVESRAGARAEDITEQIAYGFLMRLADWVCRTDDGDAPVPPSHEVSKDIVANPPGGLHPLEMIVTSPVFTADRRLLVQPGYDRDSGIWYWMSRGMEALRVPEAPTDEEVRSARSLLMDDLLVDFPFQSYADRAHALAAILLPFMKPMIRGLSPIHLIEAPAIGSGKSLLAKLAHIIATGKNAPVTTMGRDEEETRKKITSLLATGTRIVIIDNVVGGISSANLAAAITSDIWKDRWLGTQKMPELPNSAIWFFTGNNPDLSLEIARRCIRIRIESPDERPWLRNNFKHDPIEDWALEHRSEIVQAILVLIQAWVSEGAPLADVTMGSFQQWAKTIGGILEFLDIPGFLDNRDEMFEVADAREMEWRCFVQAWWDEYGGAPVATSDLRTLAQQHDMLTACRGTKSDASQTIRLGKELRSLRGRRFGNLKIVPGRPARNKTNRWALVRVPEDDNTPEAGPPSDDEDFSDPDATVTDLFTANSEDNQAGAPSEQPARGVKNQPPAQPPAPQTRTNRGPRGVVCSAGGYPGVRSRTCGRTRTPVASGARAVREAPDHYIQPPATPRGPITSRISSAGGYDNSPFTPHKPPAQNSSSHVDLADFTDQEKD